jgi:hypothetical protein
MHAYIKLNWRIFNLAIYTEFAKIKNLTKEFPLYDMTITIEGCGL